jgi:hypothetical protein
MKAHVIKAKYQLLARVDLHHANGGQPA